MVDAANQFKLSHYPEQALEDLDSEGSQEGIDEGSGSRLERALLSKRKRAERRKGKEKSKSISFIQAYEFLVSEGHNPEDYCPLKFEVMFEAASERRSQNALSKDVRMMDVMLRACVASVSKESYTAAVDFRNKLASIRDGGVKSVTRKLQRRRLNKL